MMGYCAFWNLSPRHLSKRTLDSRALFHSRFKKKLSVLLLEKFQEDIGGSLDRRLSPSFPNFRNPPSPNSRHSLTVPTSICYPNPCFVYVVSSGPFTTINHNQISIIISCFIRPKCPRIL